jgi:hypothetical protein
MPSTAGMDSVMHVRVLTSWNNVRIGGMQASKAVTSRSPPAVDEECKTVFSEADGERLAQPCSK